MKLSRTLHACSVASEDSAEKTRVGAIEGFEAHELEVVDGRRVRRGR